MRTQLLAATLLATTALTGADAQAITSEQRGAWLDLGAGLGMSRLPPRPSLSGSVAVGTWWGPYDNAYAAGRFWGLGLNAVTNWRSDQLSVAPHLEVRRGMDLFVVQTWFGASVAPIMAFDANATLVGGAARVNGGARYRKFRYWSATVRLGLGADYLSGQVSPAGELTLGVGWSKPGAKSRAAK